MVCRSLQPAAFALFVLASARSVADGLPNEPSAALASLPAGQSSFPEYRVTRWTAENGLPQNSIRALFQTRDGYLWVGTLKGLARFDGVKFTIFDTSNTPQMAADAINGLVEDLCDHSLWIGTADGLLRYREHRFERIAQDRIYGPVSKLCPAREGGVFFPSDAGQIAIIRDATTRLCQFGSREGRNNVEGVVQESSSRLMLLLGPANFNSFRSIHRLDLNATQLTGLPLPPERVNCLSLFRDEDDFVWLCRRDGIWRGRPGATDWTRVTTANIETGPWPGRVYRTNDGQVWVMQFDASQSRLCRLVNDHLEQFPESEFSADPGVTQLVQDREGDLWVGTTTGLYRLQPKSLRVFSRRDGMRNDDAQAVLEGADGTIWVGTDKGISGIRDGKVIKLPLLQADQQRERAAVFVSDSQGTLWMGWDDDKLARFAGDRWELRRAPLFLGLSQYWRAIFADREDRLWMGGLTNRLLCCEREKWIYPMNVLPHGDVRLIYQDRRGDMWFGTFGGGLNRLHDGKVMSFKTDRGEQNNRMWWIHEDVDGIFWVATEDGLNRFVPPEVASPHPSPVGHEKVAEGRMREPFFTFTREQGLGENVVNNIQEDNFGYLWLSGLRGIHRISRQQLNDVAAGKREPVECLTLGEADGMLNSECNGGDNQPAGCKDRLGRIWFPTAKGVVMIDPKQIHRNEVPPPVVIEQVWANDRIIFGDGELGRAKYRDSRSAAIFQQSEVGGSRPSTLNLQLPPGGARVLEIRYTANTFVAPERTTFKYRLLGYENDWRDAGDRRVAFYTNLRPHEYQFEVKARNHHGVWSERLASFAFIVAPHFYETWPFYGLCALGAVSMAGGLQAYRLRVQRRILQLKHQRTMEQERVRIARDLHDELGTALTGLALELDVAGGEAEQAPGVAQRLAHTAERTRGLAERMREVVWTVNPRCDTVSSLADFLETQASQFLQAEGTRVRTEFPEDIPLLPLSAEARHHLALCVREALTNVVRHANATEVVLSLGLERSGSLARRKADGTDTKSDMLVIQVKDNGRGLQPAGKDGQNGHGLNNMRERLEQIGGAFECSSPPGEGTVVTLRLPLSTS